MKSNDYYKMQGMLQLFLRNELEADELEFFQENFKNYFEVSPVMSLYSEDEITSERREEIISSVDAWKEQKENQEKLAELHKLIDDVKAKQESVEQRLPCGCPVNRVPYIHNQMDMNRVLKQLNYPTNLNDALIYQQSNINETLAHQLNEHNNNFKQEEAQSVEAKINDMLSGSHSKEQMIHDNNVSRQLAKDLAVQRFMVEHKDHVKLQQSEEAELDLISKDGVYETNNELSQITHKLFNETEQKKIDDDWNRRHIS